MPMNASAEEKSPRQPSLIGAEIHLQIGLGILETFTGESTRFQPHPRATIRYDRSATMVWRVVARHQRILDDGGHAELTISPAVLRRWRLSDSVFALAGGGLSVGAFTRFLSKAPDVDERDTEYAIPITAEASATIVWQWKSWLSLELTLDYRPVFFADGAVEHLLTQSLSASLDF